VSESLSDLLKKADALIARRRSFVAASKSEAASEDLPVLTDVVTALSSEVAAPIQPDPLLVESLVEQRLQQLLPARVEAQVAERLEQVVPARVAEALAARLAQVLPDKLEEALPARLAQVLPNEVEKALQPRLESALRLHLAEHLARTQPQMAELLRSWLTVEVPQILSKELFYVADRIAARLATEFNAAVLPQLDALLTPPEQE
jgi:uncharacterized membrane protein YheB (UPF0754 family)